MVSKGKIHRHATRTRNTPAHSSHHNAQRSDGVRNSISTGSRRGWPRSDESCRFASDPRCDPDCRRARPLVRSRAFAVEGFAVDHRTTRSLARRRVRRSTSHPVMGCPRGIVEYLTVCLNSDGWFSDRPRGPWGEGHGCACYVRETCVHHTYIDPKVSITCKVNNLFVKLNDGS